MSTNSKSGKGFKRHTFAELQDLTRGKRVALIGNGMGLLHQGLGEVIDSYDFIFRMNRGFPWVHPEDLGTRTDGWAINSLVNTEDVFRLAPKWVIHATPLEEDGAAKAFQTEVLDRSPDFDRACHAYRMTMEQMIPIKRRFRMKPTTGARLVFLLADYCRPQSITLFGFDFLRTRSWYWAKYRELHNHRHLGKDEEYVISQIRNVPMFIQREKRIERFLPLAAPETPSKRAGSPG